MIEPAYKKDLHLKYPRESKPGEVGECDGCGLEFEQQTDGLTAGNYCMECWELRKLRLQWGLDRMDRHNKWDVVFSELYLALLLGAFVFFAFILPRL